MDTTYFGRDFGVMVLMDSISEQALFVGEVKHETNALERVHCLSLCCKLSA